MSGGGGGTQVKTQQTDLPAWTQDAQQWLTGTGQGMAANFLRNPTYGVVGTNPDQEMGYDLARQTALNTFNTPGLSAVNSGAGTMTAAQIGPHDYEQFLDPYKRDVVGTTLDSMRGEWDRQGAAIDAREAAGSAFAGSGTRGAVQRAELDRNYAQQISQTVAQLMSQGYSQAQATAMANAQMRQTASQVNATNRLQAIQMDNTNLNDRQRREMLSTAQLTGYGDAQQKWQQSAMDVPWTMLQRLLGVTPSLGNVGGTVTTTEPDNTPSTGSQILGGLMSIGGAALGAAVPGGGSVAGGLLSGMLGLGKK